MLSLLGSPLMSPCSAIIEAVDGSIVMTALVELLVSSPRGNNAGKASNQSARGVPAYLRGVCIPASATKTLWGACAAASRGRAALHFEGCCVATQAEKASRM